jgi:hypothetical protein
MLVVKMIMGSEEAVDKIYNELSHLEENNQQLFIEERYKNGLNIVDHIPIPEAFHDHDIPIGTNPFNISLEEIESPEEKDTPLPCSFTEPLLYLTTTHAVAIEKHRELLKTNVSQDFIAAVPEIIDYLLSEDCLNVFCPPEWKGLKIEPYDLEFRADMPNTMRCKARPINPKIYENAKLEFDRMKTYFYTESTSDIAVNLVVASKATPPYIRLCGNYPDTNSYLTVPRYPIPNVEHELGRIRTFTHFIDIDMMNSFHQIPLSEATSNKLSIITPFGLYRPLYLPEGVSSATAILQIVVTKIFHDFKDFLIVIFDNFLLMANSYTELLARFKLVIARANQYNLVLKMAKSKFGFSQVDFFGYQIQNGTVKLAPERALQLQDVLFPSSVKEVQRFLGSANFFARFILNYASLSAPLHDMTKKDFSWHKALGQLITNKHLNN